MKITANLRVMREIKNWPSEPIVKYVRPNEFRDIGSSVMIVMKNGGDHVSSNIRIEPDGTVVNWDIGASKFGEEPPTYQRIDVEHIDNWRRDGKYIRWIVDGRKAPKVAKAPKVVTTTEVLMQLKQLVSEALAAAPQASAERRRAVHCQEG